MKLYLVSQNVNNGYDTYDSFVCCASDEIHAKEMHPNGYGFQSKWDGDTWVARSLSQFIHIQYLGEASPELPAGVVLASFNAG